MRLNLTMKEQAKVITKKKNDYEFNGRKGTSYILGLRIGQDLQEMSATEELFGAVQEDQTYTFGGFVNTSYANQKFTLDMVVSTPLPKTATK